MMNIEEGGASIVCETCSSWDEHHHLQQPVTTWKISMAFESFEESIDLPLLELVLFLHLRSTVYYRLEEVQLAR